MKRSLLTLGAALGLSLAFAAPGHAVTLEHRYSFNGSANDSVGTAHLTLQGGASIIGNALDTSDANGGARNDGAFGGAGAVTQIASTINNATAITMESWFNQDQFNNWSKLMMTGTDTGLYMDITPRRGDNAFTSSSINDNAHGENNVQSTTAGNFGPITNDVEYYVATTWDTTTNRITMKLGQVGGALHTYSASMGGQQLSALPINQFYVGSAVGFGDPDFDGQVDELRIWNGALTGGQVAANFNAGPNSVAASASNANAPAALWLARDFTGGSTWVDSISGIPAVASGGPIAGSSKGVFFDGLNDQFAVAAALNPIAGRNSFTVTAIFEADGALGEGGQNRPGGDQGAFWQVSHLVGNEQGGGGVGDWGIGLGADQNIQAGVGLQGDITLEVTSGAPFNNGQKHIVSMVMDRDAGLLKIFVDGSLAASTIVNPNTVVDEGFFFGTNGAPALGDLAFYRGYLQEIGFHDIALSDADVLAIHAAGTLAGIPEPATALFAIMGLAGLAARRRRVA